MDTQKNLWIPLLTAGIMISGLIGSMFFPPFIVWALLAGGMFGAILLGNPRVLLMMFWAWASFYPLIGQINNSFIIRYTEELFAVAVLGIAGALYIWRHIDEFPIKTFKIFAISLFGIYAVSILMNRAPLFGALNYLLSYLPFMFVFYVSYAVLDSRHYRYFIAAVVGLVLIQFALNIGWRFGVNPLPNEFSRSFSPVDMAQGTYASSARVAYFMMVVLFLCFSAFRLKNRYKPFLIGFTLLVFLQLYMTYTNHAYIYMAVLFPVYLFVSKQSVRVKLFSIVALILGGILFSMLAAYDVSTEFTNISVDKMLTAETLEYRWDRFIHGPKIMLITRIAWQNMFQEPLLWLFGNGPGNGLSAIGMDRGSDFAWQYLGEYAYAFNARGTMDMTSITGSFYSGVLAIWSELGAAGYLLLVGVHSYAAGHVWLRLHKNLYDNEMQKVLAEGFVMAMLTFLMGSVLTDIFWAKYYTVGLWIWAALVWTPADPDGIRSADSTRQGEDPKEEDGDQLPARKGLQPGGRTDDQESEDSNQPKSLVDPVVNRWQRRM